MTIPGGWYDDPWSAAGLRWWDGVQWTPHTAPRGGSPAAYYFRPPADIDGTARWARRASVAVAVQAAVACVQSVLYALILHSILRDIVHQFRQFSNEVNAGATPAQLHLPIGRIYALDALSLPALCAEIIFIVWLYKAATDAERLGLPHARSPVWAILGFVVPVVSLWFPYQVARDLVPPGDPERRTAGWWWALTLLQGIPSIAVAVVSYFSITAALLLALPTCVMPIAVAIKARKLIAAATARHAALAGR